MILDPEDLRVESFPTSDTTDSQTELNCTGCDSGCGIDGG